MPRSHGVAHRSLIVALGFAVAAVADAAWGPGAGRHSSALFALAAGPPIPLDQALAFFRAIQANEVWWPVLSLAVTGGIAGTLAGYVVPGSRPGGALGTLFLGIFSAATAGWVCQRLGAPLPADVSVLGIGAAFALAVALLILGKLLARL